MGTFNKLYARLSAEHLAWVIPCHSYKNPAMLVLIVRRGNGTEGIGFRLYSCDLALEPFFALNLLAIRFPSRMGKSC